MVNRDDNYIEKGILYAIIFGLVILLVTGIYKRNQVNSFAKTQQQEIDWQLMDGIKIVRSNIDIMIPKDRTAAMLS